jgi:hypothetical protein
LMNFDSFSGKEYFLLFNTGLEKIGVRFLVWPFSGDNYSSDPFPFKLARFTFYLGVSAYSLELFFVDIFTCIGLRMIFSCSTNEFDYFDSKTFTPPSEYDLLLEFSVISNESDLLEVTSEVSPFCSYKSILCSESAIMASSFW